MEQPSAEIYCVPELTDKSRQKVANCVKCVQILLSK